MKNELARCIGLVLALAACDGGATATQPTAPPEVVPALDAFCDLLDRCPEYYPIGSRNRAECVDILYWLFTCRPTESGVERTELALDAAQAQACGDALRALSCEDLSCVEDGTCPDLGGCSALFAGFGADDEDDDSLAAGDRCYGPGSSPSCGAGLFCARAAYDEASESVACSVCAPLASAGSTCDPRREGPECAGGLGCIATADDLATGACAPLLADGAACRQDRECAGGFCSGTYPDRTCSSGGELGDPCEVRDDCRWMQRSADDITCVGGTCDVPRQLGEPCASDDACRSFHCDPSDDLCGVPDGAACTGDYECRSGFCDERICRPPRANGEPCLYDLACESTYCHPDTRLCAVEPPRAAEGEGCAQDADCDDGLRCNTVCYAPCSDDGDCEDGEYCDYDGGAPACRSRAADGVPCRDHEECASGYCSNDAEVCIQRPGIGDACAGASDCYPAGYCSGGVCVARLGPDAACSALDSCLEPYLCLEGTCTLISLACAPGAIGDQCTYLRFCDETSYCDYTDNVTCAPRLGEGEPCIAPLDQCAPDLYCDGSGACAPRAGEGAACSEPMQCAQGTVCTGGTCMPGAGGGPCEETSECPSGTYCDDDSEVCEPYRRVGDECEDPFRALCGPELTCESRVCVALPVGGEPCTNGNVCGRGFTCDIFGSRTCIARVALGAECESSPYDNCIEGTYCEYDGEAAYVCVSGAPNGAPCDSFDGHDCASGFCVEGICSARAECFVP